MRRYINDMNNSIFDKIIDTAPESISYFEKMFDFIEMFEPISSVTNMSFLDVSDDLEAKFKNLIKAHPEYLQYIQNPTASYITSIIQLQPEYVVYLKEPTDNMLCSALKKNGLILKDLPENRKTERICEVAIDQNPEAIQYVPFDTPSLWLRAISYDVSLAKHLKDFSPLIWMPILSNAPKAILYFKEITPEMIDVAVNYDPMIIFKLYDKHHIIISDEVIKKAIRLNPKVYKQLDDNNKSKFLFNYIISSIKIFFIKDGD